MYGVYCQREIGWVYINVRNLYKLLKFLGDAEKCSENT